MSGLLSLCRTEVTFSNDKDGGSRRRVNYAVGWRPPFIYALDIETQIF